MGILVQHREIVVQIERKANVVVKFLAQDTSLILRIYTVSAIVECLGTPFSHQNYCFAVKRNKYKHIYMRMCMCFHVNPYMYR